MGQNERKISRCISGIDAMFCYIRQFVNIYRDFLCGFIVLTYESRHYFVLVLFIKVIRKGGWSSFFSFVVDLFFLHQWIELKTEMGGCPVLSCSVVICHVTHVTLDCPDDMQGRCF